MKNSRNLTGILAMCAAMALFVVNDTLVKLAAVSLPTHQILFVRGVFASVLICAALIALGEHRHLDGLKHPMVVLRCAIEVFVAYTFIGALATLAIADITAILLLSPLMITVIAALVLKEQVRWRRWTAVLVGFLGMLLVIKPGGSGFQAAALLAFVSTCGVALRDIVTRKLPSNVPTLLVAASSIVVMTITGGAISLASPWIPVSPQALVYLGAAAIMVLLGNIAIIIAFRDVDVSAVSPFRYTLIVWAVIAGYIVFGDAPGPAQWAGIGLIVGSGIYTIYRESVTSKRPLKPEFKT
jgi:drug/metabolite transporter (DMT)-like permease